MLKWITSRLRSRTQLVGNVNNNSEVHCFSEHKGRNDGAEGDTEHSGDFAEKGGQQKY